MADAVLTLVFWLVVVPVGALIGAIWWARHGDEVQDWVVDQVFRDLDD